MIRLLTVLLLSAISLGACANPSSTQTVATPIPYQLIIQFRTPVDDPPKTDFAQQLSKDAGATLLFVRSLATGAQIYSVDGTLDRAAFDAVLSRLKLRHDVLYVEEDRRVQPAKKK